MPRIDLGNLGLGRPPRVILQCPPRVVKIAATMPRAGRMTKSFFIAVDCEAAP
jgi:hypothetical protein